MTNTIIVALIAGGAAIVGSGLTFLASIWLGQRRAVSEEARLGLDALKEGIAHATQQMRVMQEKADELQTDLTTMSVRVHLVLGENNWFRVLCGEEPQSSLDHFKTLAPDARSRIENLFRR